MTIRTRLTFWYAGILILSLLVIGLGTYQEIDEQLRQDHRHAPAEHAIGETSEMIFQVGLPAVALGLLGGWWLTRRALAPVKKLTAAATKIHERNLRDPLPRTRNGDELDQLTKVFNDSLARLDDSFKRIHEFTLHASHELKTPLTVLCGEIETTLCDETLPPVERERLLSQLDEVRRLSKIVDGLTLLAKADAGQVAMQFETVRLDELVRDNFADAQILAEPHGIKVDTGILRGNHRSRRPAPAAAIVAQPRGQRHQIQPAARQRDDEFAPRRQFCRIHHHQHGRGHSGGNSAARVRPFFPRRSGAQPVGGRLRFGVEHCAMDYFRA